MEQKKMPFNSKGPSRAPILAVALCAVALCVVGPAVTQARAATQFGGEGSEAGQFSQPSGVAVNQESGDVYVLDSQNQRVDRFTEEGGFVAAWGWGVSDGTTQALQTCTTTCFRGLESTGSGGFTAPEGLAIDNDPLSASHGDVYVADSRNHRVEKFGPAGEFLLMFGGEVNEATKGDVCLAGEKCQAGVEGTEPGQFAQEPKSVAVDSSGTVYVGDLDRVQEFSAAGAFQTQVALPGTGTTQRLAVDTSGDLYVYSFELSGVRKYSPAGTFLLELDSTGSPTAFTLDASDDIFVADGLGVEHHIFEYGPSGAELASFESGAENASSGIAFRDVAGVLYVLDGSAVRVVAPPPPGPLIVANSESATSVLPSTATLDASIDPEGAETGYEFEYGTTAAYGAAVPVPAGAAGSDFADHAVNAGVSELQPSTTYHYRVVASNSAGTARGPDQTFTTSPPALIDSESVSDVAATSATLEATINPLGSDTSFHFRYGPTAACGGEECSVPVPDADLGSGTGDVVATPQHLQGLQPSTTYHYRVVAHNVFGTAEGEERTFTTGAGGGELALPDKRAWEMVSPPDKHGGVLLGIGEAGVIQAAADGSAISYLSSAPSETAAKGFPFAAQIISHRGSSGWTSHDILTRHGSATGAPIGIGYEARFFSSDLSLSILEPQGEFTPQTGEETGGEATERTVYRRSNFTCEATPATCYTPLVSQADVPSGTNYGGDPGHSLGAVQFVDATSDASHVILQSGVPLTATRSDGGLYEWSSGALQLVSVLPGGEAATGAQLGYLGTNTRNAISSDGSHIDWSTSGNGATHLYMRDTALQRTIQLDAVQPGASGEGPAEAHFQAASADGRRVFFTDSQRLTAGASAAEGNPDLYEFDLTSGAVRDLTVPMSTGERADVQGETVGVSEDGSYVYFVADGELASGATPGTCTIQPTPAESCNLYVRHDNTTTLIAVLSGADQPDWNAGSTGALNGLTARVAPGGRFLAFMSQRSLTGYDNRDVHTATPDEEVYLYDALLNRVHCASCNPTGARPAGNEYSGEHKLVGGDRVWPSSVSLAANVPGWTPYSLGHADYQSRYLSDSGRLFFNSYDALVPQDANGTWDVYEWEPPGVGGCSAGSGAFAERTGGCVSLISSGTSPDESAFLDASENGGDVFFLTAARLAPQDLDTSLDVYDAHECTTQSPCSLPPASTPPTCATGESCRPAPPEQPQVGEAPPTATFSGPGNLLQAPPAAQVRHAPTRRQLLAAALRACRRKPRRARHACEARAKRRYGQARHALRHGRRSAKSSNATVKQTRGSR